ncbi:hypothetical protein JMM61_04930 [Rhodovulum sulfidophilum]|nr:hypothetical protein [Rhodovulum sulfidophilum]
MSDGDAEGGKAVQDGDAVLEFGWLVIEAPGHELLAEQLNAVNLRFCAAAAVIAAPPSPDGPSKPIDGAQSVVPRSDAGAAVLLPGLGVSPERE